MRAHGQGGCGAKLLRLNGARREPASVAPAAAGGGEGDEGGAPRQPGEACAPEVSAD